ncbi:MAG TPA: FHA domain-containing protein [Thermoanaerobaculia bacterium]|nr:FHA domain-containing protein [Thermoanaerobaculia bacterium]
MQVILQGSLKHFPPTELLSFLMPRGQAGTLDLETPGKRTRIVYDGERITWAESSRGGEAVDAILDAFEWTAGAFTLIDSAILPEGAKALALELEPLIEEAKRRVAAATMYRNSTSFRIVENLSLQQQISLTAEDLKLLFKLTSGRAFGELVDELGVTRKELTERLAHLEELGLLMREELPAKTDPGAKPVRRRTLVGSLTPDSAPDKVYPLLESVCMIGRTDTNHIELADGSVSSRHARIVRTPEGFVIEDLQSRNGTFVNGEKVDDSRMLADGDLLRVGKVIMTFNVAREAKAGETTQPEVRVV